MARARTTEPLIAVVGGDVTVNWNLARESLRGGPKPIPNTRASWQGGGAALLADLVRAFATGLDPSGRPVEVRGPDAPAEPIRPGAAEGNHSYAIWAPFPADGEEKLPEPAWRVASFLGVDRPADDALTPGEWDRLGRELPEADVVALADVSLGFRDGSRRELWAAAMGNNRPWVVLQAGRPVAAGAFWDDLLAECGDRLIVVVTVDDLRGTEVQVTRELSWERTAQDLFWELVHKPSANALSRVAHTVVSFGAAGAAVVSGPREGSGPPSCSLFFDPQLTEGAWEAGHPGGMIGGTECLVAAIVREILLAPDEPQLGRAIQGGVAAGRRLHLEGYEELGSGRMDLGFPLGSVADEIAAGRAPLEEVAVPDPAGTADGRAWTILADRYPANLVELARDATLRGPMEALPGVPLGRFGRLVTADRTEIEAYRSVRSLIAEYCAAPASKPLSIGVFGPPGSGKSFGIVQVSRSVARSVVSDPLEFNLSQFRSPDELVDAFHLVRDEALAGSVPLVFWDEFDTPLEGRPLGWLRFFLAPMQDGAFREGQVTHPLGRCIFVFAGGTCQRAKDFGSDMDPQRFREAKGPDFVSRLKGYVDVLGPNPQGGADPHHVIRRAILLRSILRMRAPSLFDGDSLRIDPGVLRAFLETRQYRHGARSLESIVAMSRLSGMTAYERSSLPPESQLDLHVASADFLALVQRLELQGDLLERLAEAAHEVYREGLRARGYRWGPEPDDERMISESLVPYAELPELKKDQNRGTVRDIPAKLEQVGCVMVPARSEIPRFAFTAEEVDLLAREEHERWMAGLGAGWSLGERTDKALKVHEAYRPWEDLPESQRAKDRDLVRDLPEIVARAGYAIVRGGRPAEESA